MHLGKQNDYLNTGDAYRDIDGSMKQFTHVDWDPKPKINMSVSTEEEKQQVEQDLKSYKKDLIQRVLDCPASLCPLPFVDFTVRGEGITKITWNETMLRDEGIDLWRIRDLTILLENRMSVSNLIH